MSKKMPLKDIRVHVERDWTSMNPSTLRELAKAGLKAAQEELERRKTVVTRQKPKPRPKAKYDWGD